MFRGLEQRTSFPSRGDSDVLQDLREDRVTAVELRGNRMHVTTTEGPRQATVAPDAASVAAKLEPTGVGLTTAGELSFRPGRGRATMA